MTLTETRKNKINEKSIFISCVIPVFNEQENVIQFLPQLHEELLKHAKQHEIVVVDDGSTDDTCAIAKNLAQTLPVKIVRFSRNFGKEFALTAGLEHVSGDVTIIMDCDFQHPFDVIKKFLDYWAEGNDMVYGIRINREDESPVKRLFTHIFYTGMQKLTKTSIPPNAGDFRLLDKIVVNALNQCDERNRFMKGLYGWVGYRAVGINYVPHIRHAGKSRWGFYNLVELAITGITSFSSIPLRAWGFIGFIVSIISFSYALIIVFKTLFIGVDVPGFATLACAIIFFGGIQLLSIGILGEYIGRIFDEVKRRPKYIVSERIGFKENPDET